MLTYRELRQRLHRELNAEPDPETKALFQELRAEAPAAGENRLVTVLFAERSCPVEAMQHLHPEEAAALVNRLLGVTVDAILKFGGQVDRFLGDGVLAIFGVCQAHEDDAERAIRAALEIRAAARSLGMEVAAGLPERGCHRLLPAGTGATELTPIQNPKSKMTAGSGTTHTATALSRWRTAWRSMPPTGGTSGTRTRVRPVCCAGFPAISRSRPSVAAYHPRYRRSAGCCSGRIRSSTSASIGAAAASAG